MSDQAFDPDAEPAIWLYRSKGQQRSKFGGLPNLPPSISWPLRNLDAEAVAAEIAQFAGRRLSARAAGMMAKGATPALNAIFRKDRPPLHFLAQIDLSELPALPLEVGGPTLPTSGYLFFFANLSLDDHELFGGNFMENAEDNGAETRVIYARAAGTERQPPKGLPPLASSDPVWGGVFPSHPVAAKRIMTGGECPVPDSYPQSEALRWALAERDWLAGRLDVDIPATSLEWEDWARYPVALKERRHEIDGMEQVASRELHWVRHQMFGLAPTVQNEPGSTRHMTGRCGHPMIPLITFDTDWGVHEKFQFCDCGILQFWIKPEDLAARRFDRCYATTEGG